MELLYEADMKGTGIGSVVSELAGDPLPYTLVLVHGVEAHGAEIDAVLTRLAHGWALQRMPPVDRALLRLGVFELGWRPDVPAGVAISEAVELAAQFSTVDSSRFVNGVLARAGAELRGGGGTDGPPPPA